MKRPFFFLLLIFFSCGNTEKRLEAGWEAVKNGNYTVAERKFNEVMEKRQNDWNKGYSQKCQMLRMLYFTNKISRENFFIEMQAVYEQWYEINPYDTEHLVPYGVLLLLAGDAGFSFSLMNKAYNQNHDYDFENPSAKDIYNFFAGIALGQVREENYGNTIYQFMFNITEEEMINIFVGN